MAQRWLAAVVDRAEVRLVCTVCCVPGVINHNSASICTSTGSANLTLARTVLQALTTGRYEFEYEWVMRRTAGAGCSYMNNALQAQCVLETLRAEALALR